MTGLIVHEWLEKNGGAERVVERMSSVFPDARIFCLWQDNALEEAPGTTVESVLARTPLRRSKPLALPFMPLVWRNIPLDADWMLVSSHLFAHHARLRPNPEAPKLTYVHTPARYIWNPELDQRGSSFPARVLASRFKGIDRRRAAESYTLAANSQYVKQRIRDHWGLEAEVIYPPVSVARIQTDTDDELLNHAEDAIADSLPDVFILGASRFVPYKRLDLVIKMGEAAGLPVVIAGSGPLEPQLRNQAQEAKVPVQLILGPSTPLLHLLYRRATVFGFPPVEDFGIMPVEAMACGTPVVVGSEGGALESVSPGIGGACFDSESQADLRRAVATAAALNSSEVASHALKFDESVFDGKLRRWVARVVGQDAP